jgi:predicted PhzF superfamily epimerase YddE/YHI9
MPIVHYHIDSFASELCVGNPAGVCLLLAFLVNDVMQKIAEETVSIRSQRSNFATIFTFRSPVELPDLREH